MKDPEPARTDAPEPPAFKPSTGVGRAGGRSLPPPEEQGRVDYRRQAVAGSGDGVRRMASDRPVARRTFRLTVG
ncbi:MAG TPA: hypothetical protein DCM86_08545 [Verrucomicrobiales bacterium]|nr:hypothetical protein [Verrucomicrobiales bacterium]